MLFQLWTRTFFWKTRQEPWEITDTSDLVTYLVGGAMCPSWKLWLRQWGWDDIPYTMENGVGIIPYTMENKKHVWNHQPVMVFITENIIGLNTYSWICFIVDFPASHVTEKQSRSESNTLTLRHGKHHIQLEYVSEANLGVQSTDRIRVVYNL